MTEPGHAGDLPPEVFNRYGHQLIDWITAYLEQPERYPVLARVDPGAIHRALPAEPPARGESLDAILRDVESVLLPGVTHWNHPGFFAYFAITASAPGILGELLMSALNVNAMLWKTSPAATELEQVALDWLRQMLGLGPGWFGIINDTASISTLLALAAARESAGARGPAERGAPARELAIRARGMAGRADLPRLRVYTSEHAHSSVDKAAITLGFGHENVVHVPADDAYRMRADLLAAAVRDDRVNGWLPVAAIATVGTTSTTSIDPVREIAAVCRREGVWLHVDGAYGGIAAVVPELRPALDGVELADSLVVNPHKWLFTPIDCSALYVRDATALERAFSLVPEYLRTDVGNGERGTGNDALAAPFPVPRSPFPINYMDYGVQLGRRFRALKLWMVIRAFGVEGLAERIRAHCTMAGEFAAWVEAAPDWELLAPVPFSTVCFRYAPAGADERALERCNAAILDAVNASGEVFLSHTRLRDRLTLRLAIGNLRTERRHVRRAWELLTEAAGGESQAARELPGRPAARRSSAGGQGAT